MPDHHMFWRRASSLSLAVLGSVACSQAAAPSARATEPAPSTTAASNAECRIDSDCVCGRDRKTDACASGPIERVDPDPARHCPDFCGGPDGKMVQACESGRCMNVYRSLPAGN